MTKANVACFETECSSRCRFMDMKCISACTVLYIYTMSLHSKWNSKNVTFIAVAIFLNCCFCFVNHWQRDSPTGCSMKAKMHKNQGRSMRWWYNGSNNNNHNFWLDVHLFNEQSSSEQKCQSRDVGRWGQNKKQLWEKIAMANKAQNTDS